MLANGVVASSNERNSWAAAVEVRRNEKGAHIQVRLRPGTEAPSDPLLELADLADAIRSELRLERDKIGAAIYGTSESTFESEGDLRFEFDVWQL